MKFLKPIILELFLLFGAATSQAETSFSGGVLRNLAKMAGVHLYSDKPDIFTLINLRWH